MSGGGKGGKQSTKVEIPKFLEDAARTNMGRADQMGQMGYMPYYGPDVAALTAPQVAAMQGNQAAAQAFGLPGGDLNSLPAPQNFGGVSGYSSGSLFDQALAEFRAKRPGQAAQMDGMFIDPRTGAAPTNPHFNRGPEAGPVEVPQMPGSKPVRGAFGNALWPQNMANRDSHLLPWMGRDK